MKNTKFTKISLLVLALALVIGAMFAMSVSAENETKPEITQKNVSYSTNLALQLAVKEDTATAPIKLYRYDSEPAVGEVGTLVATADADDLEIADSTKNNLAYDSYVIQAPGVKASETAHYYYYKVVDANGAESDVIRYSVAEYLYDRLATEGISNTQKTLYEATIAYCDAAQVQFESEDDRISTLNLVTVDGGVVDGYAQGLYATGSTILPVGTDAVVTKWTVYKYDAEGNRTTSTAGSNEAITIEGRTEIFAGEIKEYRPGTYTFDDLTVGSGVEGVSANNGGSVAVAVDTVYGKTSNVMVIDWGDLTNNYPWFAINKTQGSSDGAVAWEVSFDIKMETPSWGNSIYWEVRLGAGYEKYDYRLYLKGYDDGFCLQVDNQKSSNEICRFDANPKEYNHIAFQVRRNDIDNGDGTTTPNTSLYVIVNGVESTVAIDTEYATFAGTDISKYSYCALRGKGTGNGSNNSNWYIDNLFMGYVK